MDGYKKLIKNQSSRMRILKCLEWIPDFVMVKIQYRIKMGRRLPLKNPSRYTEKIQWYKVYYHNPLMIECVDKYKVRDFISRIGMKEYLIPLLGTWNSSKEIEWDLLPKSFILKTTNGSETNIFVDDKEAIDKDAVGRQLDEWLTQTNLNAGREWAYNGVTPRIVCEPIISGNDQHGRGLDDYKFFCFNGHVKMMWIDYDRFQIHKRVLFDRAGNRLDVRCTYPSPEDFEYPRKAFETLLPIAETIAQGFPHSRVDLYYVNGKPYFGEITFYSGSGYEPFDSDAYDYQLGEQFQLPNKYL